MFACVLSCVTAAGVFLLCKPHDAAMCNQARVATAVAPADYLVGHRLFLRHRPFAWSGCHSWTACVVWLSQLDHTVQWRRKPSPRRRPRLARQLNRLPWPKGRCRLRQLAAHQYQCRQARCSRQSVHDIASIAVAPLHCAAQECSACRASTCPASVPPGLNAGVWLKHRENCQILFHDPLWENATTLEPLPLAIANNVDKNRSSLPPFSQSRAKPSLHTPVANIPMNWATVLKIEEHFFSTPADFSDCILQIPILECQNDGDDYAAPGLWKHVSPTETIMAWINAAAKSVLANDQAKKEEWQRCMLSTPAILVLLPNEDFIHWKSQQLRKDLGQKAVLAWTPLQRIFDVNAKRTSQGWAQGRVVGSSGRLTQLFHNVVVIRLVCTACVSHV